MLFPTVLTVSLEQFLVPLVSLTIFYVSFCFRRKFSWKLRNILCIYILTLVISIMGYRLQAQESTRETFPFSCTCACACITCVMLISQVENGVK